MIEENIKRSKKEEEKKTQTKRTRTRKENKTEKVSFEKERRAIEKGLGQELLFPIDPMKDSVERWFILLFELEKKVEYLSKKNNGKSN